MTCLSSILLFLEPHNRANLTSCSWCHGNLCFGEAFDSYYQQDSMQEYISNKADSSHQSNDSINVGCCALESDGYRNVPREALVITTLFWGPSLMYICQHWRLLRSWASLKKLLETNEKIRFSSTFRWLCQGVLVKEVYNQYDGNLQRLPLHTFSLKWFLPLLNYHFTFSQVKWAGMNIYKGN